MVEAIRVESCWLYVPTKLGFVEPSRHSNTKNDASSKFAFAEDFDGEPGSNVMSFNRHTLNWSFFDNQRHMDLGYWLITQQAKCTGGPAVKVGHFLSVKSARSRSHVMFQNECCRKVKWLRQICPMIVVTWVGTSTSWVCDACTCEVLVNPSSFVAEQGWFLW